MNSRDEDERAHDTGLSILKIMLLNSLMFKCCIPLCYLDPIIHLKLALGARMSTSNEWKYPHV